ncbi:MAG: tRNA 2-thiocytidine biosynthesis protein TtcA [Clostridiales bacterium]|nr:tRNA 2-thiocytidine biosynthesis protein TtcA [Clostridiales bacterium]
MEDLKIEQSLTKRFKTDIWTPFVKGINKYEMIQPHDKIAVCISGGKDSMLMALCFKHLHKYSKFEFDVEYIVMNPGYKEENLELIKSNAEKIGINIKIFNSDIFKVVDEAGGSPCYLCARMRRGYLYEYAQSLGCNKIALGHHFNDMVETILLSMFYGSEYKTMMPKLKSSNHEGMELIRPLYLVHEDNIIRWREYNNLKFLACACRLTEAIENGDAQIAAKRQEIKNLLKDLKKINPNIEKNIFSSIHMVNLSTVIGYKLDGKEISFLDNY